MFWLKYQITDFTFSYMLNKSLQAQACDNEDDLWL